MIFVPLFVCNVKQMLIMPLVARSRYCIDKTKTQYGICQYYDFYILGIETVAHNGLHSGIKVKAVTMNCLIN